jgi:hypothetical protein
MITSSIIKTIFKMLLRVPLKNFIKIKILHVSKTK